MFKNESYITHAVPATTNEILISKVLGASLWNIISMFVILGAIILYALITAAVIDLSSLMSSFRLLFGSIYFEDVVDLIIELLKFVPIYLISTVAMFLTFFFCDTIVQTQKTPNHRIVISVVIFIIITMFLFVIQDKFVVSIFDYFFAASATPYLLTSSIYNILQIIIFYLGCKLVIDKKMDV